MTGIAQGVTTLDGQGLPYSSTQNPTVPGGGTNSPIVSLLTSASAALSSVASSASTVSLSAANANRKGWQVFNDSSAVLYIAFAATASQSAYTTQIPPNSLYEMPLSIYTGAISGIWASAVGNARITELS